MKTLRLVLLAAIVLTLIVGFCLLNAQRGANPVLVFKGYGLGATDASQFGTFELRNSSSKAIWLCYSGTEFPLRVPFLERPMVVQSPTKTDQQANVFSVSIGHFFAHGEQLLPGQSVRFEFTLTPGKPAAQVGICYYVGSFNDGNDFLGYLGTPLLDSKASLKDKAAFYWEKSKRSFRAPKRYEVWCPQPVCFQASTSNTPTVQPEKPKAGEG